MGSLKLLEITRTNGSLILIFLKDGTSGSLILKYQALYYSQNQIPTQLLVHIIVGRFSVFGEPGSSG
jgi:hypothetical protein